MYMTKDCLELHLYDLKEDEILELAKTTSEDYIETYKYHDFLPQHPQSLVYTYKVTKDNESEEIIGYLSLCFKFENEMNGIFQNLITPNSKETILLLDKNSTVIASSDKFHIPIDAKLETDISKPFIITQFACRDYIVKTCKTNGYEGFFGLGWMGHIMIPLDSAFKNIESNINVELNLCEECHSLISYSFDRLKGCPHEIKPRCRQCPNPCYEKQEWKSLAKIMRYSGIRLGLSKIKNKLRIKK